MGQDTAEIFSVQAQNASIFVTGATGYIGRAFCQLPLPITRASTKPSMDTISLVLPHTIPKLKGFTHVLHLAGVAHDLQGDKTDLYNAVNTQGTIALFKKAQESGVKRFVYVSSIKAAGAESAVPYTTQTPANPVCAYGKSKLDAEKALLDMQTTTEVIIVRPPLVYGGEAKGNLASLSKALRYRVPLPFGAIENKRSVIHINNLIDFLYYALFDSGLVSGVYLVSDPVAVSTRQIIGYLAQELGVKPKMLNVSPERLEKWAALMGKSSAFEKFAGSLELDIEETLEACGWRPKMYI